MKDVSRELEALVREGIAKGVFPDGESAIWRRGVAAGRFSTAGERLFDLASLTKPFVASIAARLAPDDADLLPLLAHRAGLPAWTPYYRTLAGDAVLAAAEAEPAEHDPGAREVYSDVGYLRVGSLLERRAALPLDRLLEREVLAPLGIVDVRYGPVPAERAMPTERCAWRGRALQGEVHDENAHAFGRPAGHAGLFGKADGVLAFGRAWLDALAGRSQWLSAEVAGRFTRALPGGTHAPGWDTKAPEGSSAGTRLGPRSFGHLGFTGTSIWCDPDADAVVVLLTNRVHPTRDNVAIRDFRPPFHSAAASLLEIGDRHPPSK